MNYPLWLIAHQVRLIPVDSYIATSFLQATYEGVSKSFRTGSLERELQMVQNMQNMQYWIQSCKFGNVRTVVHFIMTVRYWTESRVATSFAILTYTCVKFRPFGASVSCLMNLTIHEMEPIFQNLFWTQVRRLNACSYVKVKLSLCSLWAPRHEGVLWEWRYSSTHSLISALDGGE
jgi:hypothetical protein